jgi:hypothetical protein
MKPTFFLAAIGTALLGSTSITNAQGTQPSADPSSRARMVEDADMSAQSSADLSYGGVPDTRSAAGSTQTGATHSDLCASGNRCDPASKH